MTARTHSQLQAMLATEISRFTSTVAREKRLPNNNKADIWYIYRNETYIIEVKTAIKYSLVLLLITKYYGQSDYLSLAVPESADLADYLHQEHMRPTATLRRLGLIAVGDHGVNVIRPPSIMQIGTARRGAAAGGPSSP